ncbi:hypothetical protein PHYSODRAFT_252519 [Phytophthora sojae]|uniref:Uncharacterized protein n=1 Tax=Phytophthora sojae (strain P6497) TaxID=1094619 RepID=G5ACU7_PHYSP|nr:hypothetical protein PHYSODRAFT_252519 [Phytophthora sojae]EGZ07171.1 hypothetical protein PHYSODRAFT_252519 [Phytophthora sojae]|eukprot:XP_009537935.1 hypothetical protein PHYSODRAFT_252519 [Phytophthora sojae]
MINVSLVPTVNAAAAAKNTTEKQQQQLKTEEVQSNKSPENNVEPKLTPAQTDLLTPTKRHPIDLESVDVEVTGMTKVFEEDSQKEKQEQLQKLPLDEDLAAATTRGSQLSASPSFESLWHPTVQFGIIVAVVLDFANCSFSNIGSPRASGGGRDNT